MNKDTQQVEAHEEAQVKAQEAQVTREDGTKLALSRHQVEILRKCQEYNTLLGV